MSFQAFVWAWQQDVDNSTDQHVLLALANISPLREVYASSTYIGNQVRRSERQVRRSLANLEAAGFISLTARPGKTDLIRLNVPDNFTVAMPADWDLEAGIRGRPKRAKTPDICGENPGHFDMKTPDALSYEPLEEPIEEPKELVLSAPDPFEAWWSVYPRKAAKVEARKAWGQMSKAIGLLTLAELMARTERFAQSVVNREPEHVAHPATWLRGERWNDELQPTRSQTDGQPSRHSGAIDYAAERERERVSSMLAGAQEALDGGSRRRWRL